MPEDNERIRDLERRLDALQDERRDMAEELGRLRAVAERLDDVVKERDALREESDRLRTQVVELGADLERRVGEEVQAAVASVREEHERTAKAWEAERERLRQRIAALEAAAEGGGEVVHTKDLAAQFRSVLEAFSEPEAEGAAAGAALTGLDVEARAMLAPPAEGEELPRLVMVDPAKVTNPDALSTVRLRFGLLPRLPTDQPEAPKG